MFDASPNSRSAFYDYDPISTLIAKSALDTTPVPATPPVIASRSTFYTPTAHVGSTPHRSVTSRSRPPSASSRPSPYESQTSTTTATTVSPRNHHYRYLDEAYNTSSGGSGGGGGGGGGGNSTGSGGYLTSTSGRNPPTDDSEDKFTKVTRKQRKTKNTYQ